ncbi:MAG TPA: SAM-dependent methyltransferase, partial [Acidimicrobiales bacterium]|nr:SAM-dependent methyltransferase [Acidimicrobiales bacterium]
MLERPSLTAEAVTLARASETTRPADERIIDDPYAKLFLRPSGRAALTAWTATRPAAGFFDRTGAAFVACRHRFIDDHLLAALDEGVEQVVLLGAGYDARAYRFHDQIGDRPVFEVDLAATSRRKANIIERNRSRFPDANVQRVEIDFEKDALHDTLVNAGFRLDRLTFVVWEGVIMYLTRAAIKATVGALHDLCGDGSMIAMDCWYLVDEPGPLGSARRAAPGAIALIGEPVTFAMHPEDMPDFLRRLDYEAVDIADSREL